MSSEKKKFAGLLVFDFDNTLVDDKKGELYSDLANRVADERGIPRLKFNYTASTENTRLTNLVTHKDQRHSWYLLCFQILYAVRTSTRTVVRSDTINEN